MIDAKITAARAKVRELKSRIDDIARGHVPLTETEAKARVDAWIDLHVADGAARADQLALAASDKEADVPPRGTGFDLDLQTMLSLVAWVDPVALKTKLRGAVGKLYEEIGADAVAAVDRPALLERLRAELAIAERTEYDLVKKARASGLAIEHRPDMSPSILLGLT